MGLRSLVDFTFQLGEGNTLNEGSLVADVAFNETLDTLDKAETAVGSLDASEANVLLSKGDITAIRMLYVEAEGDLDIYLGGVPATTAQLTGVGGVYPTLFAGAETLSLEVDSQAIAVTFAVGDQTLAQVVNRINAAAAFVGLNGLVAFAVVGQLRIKSLGAGTSSQVAVVSGSTGVLAKLGLTATEAIGLAPTPNTSPISIRRVADSDSSQVETLKAYALLSVLTSNVYISNPSSENAVRYRVIMAGDLVAASC